MYCTQTVTSVTTSCCLVLRCVYTNVRTCVRHRTLLCVHVRMHQCVCTHICVHVRLCTYIMFSAMRGCPIHATLRSSTYAIWRSSFIPRCMYFFGVTKKMMMYLWIIYCAPLLYPPLNSILRGPIFCLSLGDGHSVRRPLLPLLAFL